MDAGPTVISVRGEARRTVAPDAATLHCGLRSVAGSAPEALDRLRIAQDRLAAALRELGGEPLTVETRRAALTWSVRSLNTYDEHDFDPSTGKHGPTGRVVAEADLLITARDLGRLPALTPALTAVPELRVNGVGWAVDDDNPAWRDVRADALTTALAKADDYAAALGGTVTTIDQVADVGLLDGAMGSRDAAGGFAVAMSGAAGGGPAGAPHLDPVPQDIRAVVEARVTADVAPPRR